MASFDLEEEHIPEERIEEFREAFSLFDENGKGEVAIDELVKTLQKMGKNPSQEEVNELIREFDANGDGMIDFEEFKVLLLKKMKNTDSAEDITDIFHCLDIRHHGYFTAKDLHSVIVGLGETFTVDEAEELVNDTKTEQPGKVNYDDFCHLVKTLTGRQ